MRLRTDMSITARSLKEVTQGSTCRPLSVVTMFSIVGKRKYTSKIEEKDVSLHAQ